MDTNIYNNDIEAQVVEIFSNNVISCVATYDIANRFETLTDAERTSIKHAFMYNKNNPNAHRGVRGESMCEISDRAVRMNYFFKMQHTTNGDFVQFTISELDIID